MLEYHVIEEYVEEWWKDRKMPDITSSDVNLRLQRKEMKKAKAIIVRATCDLPNMIVQEAVTPFEALHRLIEKYSVKQVGEDLIHWILNGMISKLTTFQWTLILFSKHSKNNLES